MRSRLYDCKVSHSRTRPKKHAFSYRLFMFYIDLDEIETISRRLKLVSQRGWAPYQLRTSDHYDAQKASIKENILTYLEDSGYERENVGRIYLLTHLRTFGHIFNPVSFYFVGDKSGEPLCSIAEVDNTFNEQKLFLINQPKGSGFSQNHRKLFYVSPYSDLDTIFHFNLRKPEQSLRLGINQSDGSDPKPFFRSALTGTSVPMSDRALASYSLRFPAITIGIVVGIHWHALLLFLKGHRARKKTENPELQTKKRTYLKPRSHPIH